MKAGDILRVLNDTAGTDFFYLVNEIQMGDTGCESIVILQSLSRMKNQTDNASHFHQVPYALITHNDSYEVYTRT